MRNEEKKKSISSSILKQNLISVSVFWLLVKRNTSGNLYEKILPKNISKDLKIHSMMMMILKWKKFNFNGYPKKKQEKRRKFLSIWPPAMFFFLLMISIFFRWPLDFVANHWNKNIIIISDEFSSFFFSLAWLGR